MTPDWLPAKLSLNGSLDEVYSRLNGHYLSEIAGKVVEVEGIPVIYNDTLDPEMPMYTRGFTHLVTREVNQGLRSYDPDRAEKLSWVVPILENYKDPCINCFWFETPRGAVLEESLAIWYEEGDYVLILRWVSIALAEKILITAHHVDSGNRSYWQRKMRRATSRILVF